MRGRKCERLSKKPSGMAGDHGALLPHLNAHGSIRYIGVGRMW